MASTLDRDQEAFIFANFFLSNFQSPPPSLHSPRLLFTLDRLTPRRLAVCLNALRS